MITELRLTIDPVKLVSAMARLELNITELARRAGTSRVTMQHWVNARSLTPKQLGKLAKALEVDVNDLI